MKKFQLFTFGQLKFRFSKKTTKISRNFLVDLKFTKQLSRRICFEAFLENLNFIKTKFLLKVKAITLGEVSCFSERYFCHKREEFFKNVSHFLTIMQMTAEFSKRNTTRNLKQLTSPCNYF